MKMLYALIFIFIILKAKRVVSYSLFTGQCDLKGALRKKLLINSFVEHFTKIHKNIKSIFFSLLFLNLI